MLTNSRNGKSKSANEVHNGINIIGNKNSNVGKSMDLVIEPNNFLSNPAALKDQYLSSKNSNAP